MSQVSVYLWQGEVKGLEASKQRVVSQVVPEGALLVTVAVTHTTAPHFTLEIKQWHVHYIFYKTKCTNSTFLVFGEVYAMSGQCIRSLPYVHVVYKPNSKKLEDKNFIHRTHIRHWNCDILPFPEKIMTHFGTTNGWKVFCNKLSLILTIKGAF